MHAWELNFRAFIINFRALYSQEHMSRSCAPGIAQAGAKLTHDLFYGMTGTIYNHTLTVQSSILFGVGGGGLYSV